MHLLSVKCLYCSVRPHVELYSLLHVMNKLIRRPLHMLRFLLSANLLHIFVDIFSNHDLSYYCCVWHLWLLINSNLLIIFYFSCSLSNWKMLTTIFHVLQMIWLVISNLCQVLHDFCDGRLKWFVRNLVWKIELQFSMREF